MTPWTLSVESLVLHGLPLDRRGVERLRARLTAELGDRLAEVGWPEFQARLSGPLTIYVPAGATPEAMAVALADRLAPSSGGNR